MLPVSELNRLRRELVAELQARRREPQRWTLRSTFSLEPAPSPCQPRSEAELIVLTRSIPQLEAAIDAGVSTFYCEFEDLKNTAKQCRSCDLVTRHAAARSNSRSGSRLPGIQDW
jgi:hypothetical protein